MSCDAYHATMRLIALYIERALREGESFTRLINLSDVVNLENVEAVSKLDLLREFDFDAQIELLKRTNWEVERGQRMILASLPTLRNVSDLIKAPKPAAELDESQRQDVVAWNEMTEGSGRNNALFRDLGHKARHVANFDELLAYARSRNAEFGESMTDAELVPIAGRIWGYECAGTNWFGAGKDRQKEVDSFVSDPDGFLLLHFLRSHQGADATFMVTNGLAEKWVWDRDC
jgi:hypothetical protein